MSQYAFIALIWPSSFTSKVSTASITIAPSPIVTWISKTIAASWPHTMMSVGFNSMRSAIVRTVSAVGIPVSFRLLDDETVEVFGRLRDLWVHRFHGREQEARDRQAGNPLVVSWHDVPRRPLGRRRGDRCVVEAQVLIPLC